MTKAPRIRKKFSIRIIPLTMVMCVLLLGIKVGDLFRGTTELSDSLVGRVVAQQPEATDKEAKAKEDAEEASQQQAAATTDASEKPETRPDAQITTAETAPAVESGAKPGPEKTFSQVEVELLQSLAKRREELEQWSKDIQMRETLLTATEKRLDSKITEIQALRDEVSKLMLQYNEKEDARVQSLVKIYENMKPKEAASIFEEMDMPVLIKVVDRMSERKVAPILAGMTPKKAMMVTARLAEQRKVKQPDEEQPVVNSDQGMPPSLN